LAVINREVNDTATEREETFFRVALSRVAVLGDRVVDVFIFQFDPRDITRRGLN
jgi:hypothetical protein